MELLRLEEVASILNIDLPTLQQYVASGRLRLVKLDDQDYILRSELEPLLQGRTQPGGAPGPAGPASPAGPAGPGMADPRARLRGTARPPGMPHPGKNIRTFEGITSTPVETLVDMAHSIKHLDELKDFMELHGRESLDLIAKIEADGITDPHTAIMLLLYDEAIQNLSVRRDLFIRIREERALIFLPLPPNIRDPYISIASPNRILNTDRERPHDLREGHYIEVEATQLMELSILLKGVDAAVLDAYVDRDGTITVRVDVLNLIFLLSRDGLKDLFIHRIPQRPTNMRFISLPTALGLNITYI